MPLNISVPVENTMEPIEATQVSPLISKCKVKVCYVSNDPNRNGTVITKEVAEDMGKTLPGSPVVGYFNQSKGDFEEHSRELVVENGEYKLIDITRPYGFVPTDAYVGFEKFKENGVEREYLVTECYLWTEVYPECKRVIEKGNNQSMELTNDTGFWAKDNNSNRRIFIYNEALIGKLCILGEDCEPCFEGAQFVSDSPKLTGQDFNAFASKMYSMITELQETLNKGGSQTMEQENVVTNPGQEPGTPNPNPDFACGTGGGTSGSADTKKKDPKEEPKSGSGEESKPSEEKKDKKNYNLEEVTEYQELVAQYNALQSQYSILQQQKAEADKELVTLREFKLTTDRQTKQDMINSFSMLTDEQKKDVVEHMDTYSLDDIEAKLSIACVRNRVNFSQEQPTQQVSNPQGMFSLEGPGVAGGNNDIPEWIKAVQAVAQN